MIMVSRRKFSASAAAASAAAAVAAAAAAAAADFFAFTAVAGAAAAAAVATDSTAVATDSAAVATDSAASVGGGIATLRTHGTFESFGGGGHRRRSFIVNTPFGEKKIVLFARELHSRAQPVGSAGSVAARLAPPPPNPMRTNESLSSLSSPKR